MKAIKERAGIRMHGQANTRNAGHVPPIRQNLDGLKAHELRALDSTLERCFTDGSIADANVREYSDFQKQVQATLQQRAAAPEAETAKAPTYLRSMGDSEAGLAKNFSISKAIVAAAEGRQLDGAEAEVTAEGRRQFAGTRGQIVIPNFVLDAQKRAVYGNDSGSANIDSAVTGRQTLAVGYQQALHIQPLAEQLGARVVDAVGSATMLIPYLGRTAAGSTAEGAAATSSATFSELSLTPTRYARVATYSALALRTTGQALDSILTADFQQAHTSAHDAVAFAAIRANSTYTLATENGTNGLEATSLSNVFELAKEAMSATGTNSAPALVCSPEGYKVMNTATASGLIIFFIQHK